jgi:GDP-L-fucose synthase
MKQDSRIYVAGHKGMVGSAIWRDLEKQGYSKLVGMTSSELDLTRQKDVEHFFDSERPEIVFLAAARVGGILANATYPAQFLYQNMAIEQNVIHAAWKFGSKELLFLGSSCIYPKECPQPIKEEYLLTSPLESTNEAYAIAKIAGVKLCEFYNEEYGTRFWPVMPTNLFGPGDNFDLESSHVLAAMIRKFYLGKLAENRDVEGIMKDQKRYGSIPVDISESLGFARSGGSWECVRKPKVLLWGTGKPKREFLHVDDLAKACIHIMKNKNERPQLVNIGSGRDISIGRLAELMRDVVSYKGEIEWDQTKPDGTPRKLLDISRINVLGWRPEIGLVQGIERTYQEYKEVILS